MHKSVRLFAILCALCTWAPVLTSAMASDKSEDHAVVGVQVAFDLSVPDGGPFPSDLFTVADFDQLTGRRVDMPMPDCVSRPSDCLELGVINQLDGFSLLPRLSIRFTGPIDITTVNSSTVFLVSLGDLLTGRGTGEVVGINQIVWDSPSNTLHAQSDHVLDQHARYALIVTNGVHDSTGNPVGPGLFGRFRHDLNFGQMRDPILKEYRKALLDALETWGGDASAVVAASVFTTHSPTAIMEKIRDQINAGMPRSAVFDIAIDVTGNTHRGLFNMADIPATSVCNASNPDAATNRGLCLYNQTKASASAALSGAATALDFGRTFAKDPVRQQCIVGQIAFSECIGQIAFGKYLSPDYETAGKYIPQVPTRTDLPAVQGTNEIYFNLLLPAGPKPANGWPVAIFGHGLGESKQGGLFTTAARMAAHGIATIGINSVGQGLGPSGVLTVRTKTGGIFKVPAGGRGTDLDGNGTIDATEGLFASPPYQFIINERDGRRQTIADTMQLVRVIEVGMDIDGDGTPDVDPSRIYYFGQSGGGINGFLIMALEQSVHSGVMNAAGGPILDEGRLGNLRSTVTALMNGRKPSLFNVSANPPAFNENIPLRDQLFDCGGGVQCPTLTNDVAGAMDVQEAFDRVVWADGSGDPVTYAAHIRQQPLDGVPAKNVIVQFAKGDMTCPNPTTSALLRAGNLADRATYYRYDLIYPLLVATGELVVPPLTAAEFSRVKNPHPFMPNATNPPPAKAPNAAAIAFAQRDAAQEQIAVFFESGGQLMFDPDGAGSFFETPIQGELPEILNFIP